MAAPLIEFLRKVPLFSGLDDYALERMIAMSTELQLNTGDVLIREGEMGSAMYIILEGELQVRKMAGKGEVVLAKRHPGEVIGEMSVLDASPRLATVIALTPGRVLCVDHESFMALLDLSPNAARAVLRTFAQRIRSTQATLQQQEKLASLGTLSAGIAHELNNPAAAVKRAAAQLREDMRQLEQLNLQLDALELSPAQRAALNKLGMEIDQQYAGADQLDPLTRADLEGEIQEWLEQHNIPEPWEVAPRLVALGLNREQLEQLAGTFGEKNLPLVIAWAAARGSGVALLDEIASSAQRISEIVKAVKEYSYLDQAPLQEVDIHEGLENTLTILRSKWKQGVTIVRNYDRNLPKVEAFASELNQVWTNIIDNAIQAMDGKGTLTICTYAEPERVCVEICDTGPGIPPENLNRIFDAFFTTKPVGVGTGLGLHISYNIIALKHHGEITATSEPGNTCFKVGLPIHYREEKQTPPARP